MPPEAVLRQVETDADLEAIVEVRRRTAPEVGLTREDLRAARSFLRDLYDVVAWVDGEPAGFGYSSVLPGAEAAEYTFADFAVLPELRRRGIGSALHDSVLAHARSRGRVGLQVEASVAEPDSIGFLERRGYVEVERQQGVVLELAAIDPPEVEPPEGIRIVTRRPEHERGMYEVDLEASRDIPGLDSEHEPTFESWRSGEVERPTKPAEFTFVALAGDEVVGFAALNAASERIDHGLTAVRRAWRGRGIATALKHAQIRKAKEAGYERLFTESEERNVPMRKLNERLGYQPLPALVVFRGPG